MRPWPEFLALVVARRGPSVPGRTALAEAAKNVAGDVGFVGSDGAVDVKVGPVLDGSIFGPAGTALFTVLGTIAAATVGSKMAAAARLRPLTVAKGAVHEVVHAAIQDKAAALE